MRGVILVLFLFVFNFLFAQNVELVKSGSHSVKSAKAPVYYIDEDFSSSTFPPTGWAQHQQGASNSGWQRSDYEYAYHWYTSSGVIADDWLVTKSVTVNSERYYLSFYEATYYSSYCQGHYVVVMDNQDPDLATLKDTIYSFETPPSGWQDNTWYKQEFSLSAYNGQTIYIAFVYTGQDADVWYIDEVQVFEKHSYDLAVVDAYPEAVRAGGDVAFSMWVKNVGYNTYSGSLSATIKIYDSNNSEVFSTTGTFDLTAGLVANSIVILNFADLWKDVPQGAYTMKAYINYDSDEDHSDDTLTKNFNALQFSYVLDSAYSYDVTNGNFIKIDVQSGNYNSLGAASIAIRSNDYVGDWDTTVILSNYINNYGNWLYYIDGDGSTYKYTYLSGVGESVTGLTWDKSSNALYIVGYGYDNTVGKYYSKLYKITDYARRTVSGVAILGSANDNLIFSGIACDAQGHMYGATIYTDSSLYFINQNTGAITQKGPLHVNTGGKFLDIGFDRNQNKLYGTIYNDAISKGGFYSIDTTSGNATLIGSYAAVQEIGVAVYKSVATYENNIVVKENLQIYPNPAFDQITVQAQQEPEQVIITDLQGHIVKQLKAGSEQFDVNVKDLSPGIYIIKVIHNNQIYVGQFIKL